MSYNSYKININNSPVSYIESTVEVGYFPGIGYSGNNNSAWYSCPTVLQTNNGLATVDTANSGLKITNPGIYRLSVAVNPYEGGGGGNFNTIYFAFGTGYLNNASAAGFLGGSNHLYMKTLSPQNNYTSSNPAIITWNVSSASQQNGALGKFSFTNNMLYYEFYNKSDTSGNQFTGILTSELLFTTSNSGATIYLNIGQSNGNFFNNSYFVLNMISSVPITPPPV